MTIASSLFGTPYGNRTIQDGGGGTLEDPRIVAGNLATVDVPGEGYLLLNANPNDRDFSPDAVLPFDSWKVHGPSAPYDGAVPEGFGWVNAYNELGRRRSYYDESHYGGERTQQMLVPGEALPVWHSAAAFQIPSSDRIAAIWSVLLNTTNVGWLVEQPRLRHFIDYLVDENLPETTPNEKTDMGSVMRYLHRLTGGEQARGWYSFAGIEGDNFQANEKYNAGFLRLVKFLVDPRPETWYSHIYQTYWHACFGRIHSGSRRGMARYPKGTVREAWLGDGPSWSPVPEKQFQMSGVVFSWHLTGSVFLGMIVEEWLAYLERADVASVWPLTNSGAKYGARRPMRRLLEYVLAFETTRDASRRNAFIAKAEELLAIVDAAWNPVEGCWPNTGNYEVGAGPWERDTSPWMQWKLVLAVAYAAERGLIPATWRDKCLEWGERIWDDPRTWEDVGGVVPLLDYRYDQSGTWNMHRSGWLVGALRHLASFDPGVWSDRYDEQRDFLLDYAGSPIEMVASRTPRDLATLGAIDGREGVAWFGKTSLFYGDGLCI